VEGSRRLRAGLSDLRQVCQRRGTVDLQGHHRYPRRTGRQGAAAGAAGAGGGLWRAAIFDFAVHRTARTDFRPRHATRGADHLPAGVRAPACAFATLPPGAADRRPDARHRTRHARHRFADQLYAVFDPADAGGNLAGAGHPAGQIRNQLCLDHRCHADRLYRPHHRHHQLAHPSAARSQRTRLGRQLARHRQPAQLRDGQVLQQRSLRGAPLRRTNGEMGSGAGEEPDVAVPAQPRPGAGDCHRRGADDVARHRWRSSRQHDGGGYRAGECIPDPALHSAQLPRRALPRDPPVAHRHRTHVHPDAAEPRSTGCARCTAIAARTLRHRFPARQFQLRDQAADTVRCRLRYPGRPDGGRGRPQRLGQEHAGALAVSFL